MVILVISYQSTFSQVHHSLWDYAFHERLQDVFSARCALEHGSLGLYSPHPICYVDAESSLGALRMSEEVEIGDCDSAQKTASKSWAWVNWSSLVFALLQSFCSALIAISGLRVAIGLGALAAAAGVDAPARGFHADAIRIPMMALALAGSLLNLYFLWHVRRLRNRSAARWRQKPISRKKRNSERLQFVLSMVTLVLLAAEWFTHTLIHRVH
jgi:hypothetical protein